MKAKKWIKLICLFCVGLCLSLQTLPVMSQPNLTGEEWVKQGETFYDQGSLSEAVDAYQKAVDTFQKQLPQQKENLAITATNLCKLELEIGNPENALKSCQLALNNYSINSKDLSKQAKFYYANGLQQLGFFNKACVVTTDILEIENKICQTARFNPFENQLNLSQIKQDNLSIKTWGLLGEVLRNMGQLKTSKLILEQLTLTQDPAILLSLANTYTAWGTLEQERGQNIRYDYHPWRCEVTAIPEPAENNYSKNYSKAIALYQQLINSTSGDIQLKAKLNTLQVLLQQNRFEDAYKLTESLDSEKISNQPLLIETNINLAKAESCFLQQQTEPDFASIIARLDESVQVARKQNNPLLLSHTLGILGGFYEYLTQQNFSQNQQSIFWGKAQQLTSEALYLAQSHPDLAYQWQWQLGRIYQAQKQPKTALTYYQSAINTLETVRQDLLTLNSDVQFSFRDKIEPLYRSYIELLLTTKMPDNQTQTLSKVIQQIEALQLAELENFLQCDLSSQTNLAQVIDNQSMIIYPIQLKEQLAILYQLPSQDKLIGYHSVNVSSRQVTETLVSLQNNLREEGKGAAILPKAQQLYQWIIKPLEPILTENPQVNTLAFILDGGFRNIPMSVLYDGEKYLLEKDYAIAVIPSLSLLQPPSSLNNASVLTGGVSLAQSRQQFENYTLLEKIKEFEEIRELETELETVKQFHSSYQSLTNQSFTKANIQRQMQTRDFSVIHWKTHGVFSSNPQDTYLVAYKELINPNDLSQLINAGNNNQEGIIDLLVLSACETAQGDNRAVLGLAGMAIKAGAKSTISTLWRARDQPNTKLMAEFYRLLYQPNLNKAQALHQAQQTLFKTYKDPYIWATYILVGSWR